MNDLFEDHDFGEDKVTAQETTYQPEYNIICSTEEQRLTLKYVAQKTKELGATFTYKTDEEENSPLIEEFTIRYEDEKGRSTTQDFNNDYRGKKEAIEFLEEIEELMDVLSFLSGQEDTS